MAGRLPGLNAEEQRAVIATLDLTGNLDDPKGATSPITVTGREGAAALAGLDLLHSETLSSTEV
jgi:hypothetical protein